MCLSEMENYIQTARTEFATILRTERKTNAVSYVLNSLKECCSEFEERTLTENFAEEYQLYLNEVA